MWRCMIHDMQGHHQKQPGNTSILHLANVLSCVCVIERYQPWMQRGWKTLQHHSHKPWLTRPRMQAWRLGPDSRFSRAAPPRHSLEQHPSQKHPSLEL